MPLLDVVDNAWLTKLQRFVQATTLIPGEEAAISARDLTNLGKAVKAFAEAGARDHAESAMDKLVDAYKDTPYAADVVQRVNIIKKRWALADRRAGEVQS